MAVSGEPVADRLHTEDDYEGMVGVPESAYQISDLAMKRCAR